MMKTKYALFAAGILVLAMATGSGCGQKAADPVAAATTSVITGTLSGSTTTTARMATQSLREGRISSSAATIAAGTTIKCTDADGNLVCSSDVSTAGAFSLSCPNTLAISCSILVDGVVVGPFIFENSAQASLSGNAQQTDSLQFGADTALGTMAFDEASGSATVDITAFLANLAAVKVAPAVITALNGNYKISALDLPAAAVTAGYKSVCAQTASHTPGAADRCDGSPDGFALYLKFVHGTSTAGADEYGMLLWQSKTGNTACGNVVGASAADILADLGVTFDDSAGEFTYATTATTNAGATVTLTDGWKIDGSTSQYTMNDCGPFSEGTTHGWECTDASGAKQRNRGGGCYLQGTTTAVQPDRDASWSGMECDQSTTSDGYNKSICTGSMAVSSVATNVTCKNESKIIKADGTAGTFSDFSWNTIAVKIEQGALCSSSTDALVGLQCFAQAYYQSSLTGSCLKNISTNWTATTAADFLTVRGPKDQIVRALGTVGLNSKGKPAIAGLSVQQEYRGVQQISSRGQMTYTPCRVENTEKLAISVTDVVGVLTATYESSTVNLDKTVPACQAEFTGAKEKFMFKLTAISDAEAEVIQAAFAAEEAAHH